MLRKRRLLMILAMLLALVLSVSLVYADEADDPGAETVPLQITTTYLPLGRYGEEYQAQIAATGGSGGYEFSLAGGSMPAGLDLNIDGKITGIPRDSGGFGSIIFQVRDSEGNTASRQILLSIYAEYINFRVTDYQYAYDGNAHQAVLTPLSEKITADDIAVSYNGMESQTNPGYYLIDIQINKGGYRVGTLDHPFLHIEKSSDYTLRLESEVILYDGNPHSLTPVIEPASLMENCEVTYEGIDGTNYARSTAPPSEAGTYRVVATVNSPYYVTRSATATLEIYKTPVNFTVSDQNYVYDGAGHQATVVQDSGSAYNAGFTVTYDDLSTADTETFSTVTNAGTYRVNITLLDDSEYAVGTVTPNTLVIAPKPVDFTVTDNVAEPDPDQIGDGHVYSAVVRPADEETYGDLNYVVYYTRTGTEGGAPIPDGVVDPGVYDISVEVTDPNYTAGTLSATQFSLRGVKTVNFTVTENEVTAEVGSAEHYSAVITPGTPNFTNYTVIYTDTNGRSYENHVAAAGTYTITLRSNDESFKIGTITPDTFRLTLTRTVNFTITSLNAICDPGTSSYGAVITPSVSDGFGEADRIVSYTAKPAGSGAGSGSAGGSGAAAGESAVGAVAVPGEYIVSVRISDDAYARGYRMGRLLSADGSVLEEPVFRLYNIPASLEITTAPKLQYNSGEKLNLADLKATLHYVYDEGAAAALGFDVLGDSLLLGDDAETAVSVANGKIVDLSLNGKNLYAQYTADSFEWGADGTEQEGQVTATKAAFTVPVGTLTVNGEARLQLGFGNSPAAEIVASNGGTLESAEAALDQFAADHLFNGMYYAPEAWNDAGGFSFTGENGDEDVYAYLISGNIAGNAVQIERLKKALSTLGFEGVYSDDQAVSAEDISITIGSADIAADERVETPLADWTPRGTGEFAMTYRFTDARPDAELTGETVSRTRRVVILSRLGDVNGDGNLNIADANYLANLITPPVAAANEPVVQQEPVVEEKESVVQQEPLESTEPNKILEPGGAAETITPTEPVESTDSTESIEATETTNPLEPTVPTDLSADGSTANADIADETKSNETVSDGQADTIEEAPAPVRKKSAARRVAAAAAPTAEPGLSEADPTEFETPENDSENTGDNTNDGVNDNAGDGTIASGEGGSSDPVVEPQEPDPVPEPEPSAGSDLTPGSADQNDPTGQDESTDSTEPTDPVEPTEPTDPVDPTDPTDPTEPTEPVEMTLIERLVAEYGTLNVYRILDVNHDGEITEADVQAIKGRRANPLRSYYAV